MDGLLHLVQRGGDWNLLAIIAPLKHRNRPYTRRQISLNVLATGAELVSI